MTVGFDTYGFSETTVFVVKNISTKTLNIFGIKIKTDQTYNLMNIPCMSEVDIRNSLLKGSLKNKILTNEIIIVESNIDLLQFDAAQKEFLEDAGVATGTSAGGSAGNDIVLNNGSIDSTNSDINFTGGTFLIEGTNATIDGGLNVSGNTSLGNGTLVIAAGSGIDATETLTTDNVEIGGDLEVANAGNPVTIAGGVTTFLNGTIIQSGTNRFTDTSSNSGNIRLKVAPEAHDGVVSLTTGNNVNIDVVLSENGFYTFTVTTLLRLATAGTYRKLGAVVSARRVAGTVTLEEAQVDLNLGSLTTGVTLTLSATTGNLRINIANATGETLNGRIHCGWELEDLI